MEDERKAEPSLALTLAGRQPSELLQKADVRSVVADQSSGEHPLRYFGS